jgi:hypothetical protein
MKVFYHCELSGARQSISRRCCHDEVYRCYCPQSFKRCIDDIIISYFQRFRLCDFSDLLRILLEYVNHRNLHFQMRSCWWILFNRRVHGTNQTHEQSSSGFFLKEPFWVSYRKHNSFRIESVIIIRRQSYRKRNSFWGSTQFDLCVAISLYSCHFSPIVQYLSICSSLSIHFLLYRASHRPMSISAPEWSWTTTLSTLWRWSQLTQNGWYEIPKN